MKFNNETIRTAVEEWLDNSKKAEEKHGHISDWDVSNVDYMWGLFENATLFNEDISAWNVSNVTDMSNMFWGAESFNQNIGNWNLRKVKRTGSMFWGAKSFNQDISKWNVSNITDMSNMFDGAESFNQNIGVWDMSKVTNIARMFAGAESFNQDISSWDVSNVTDMRGLFNKAKMFNQNLANWDVSKVNKDNLRWMFDDADNYSYENFIKTKKSKKEVKEENDMEIFIAMENTTFFYGDGEEFEAMELMLEMGDYEDEEHDLIERIKDQLNCEHLIFTETKNNDGEFELQRIIDLPEIDDYDGCGDGGHHGPFSSSDEVIKYVKKLKTISFKNMLI